MICSRRNRDFEDIPSTLENLGKWAGLGMEFDCTIIFIRCFLGIRNYSRSDNFPPFYICHSPNSTQLNITKVGFDTKMTVDHHPPPPPTHPHKLNFSNISVFTDLILMNKHLEHIPTVTVTFVQATFVL